MFKSLKKIRGNESGFTLTEVMIGMMILTVAIVAATNLVVGLLRANSNAVHTLQAYYLAQEGIESVRNIRDTNWLHNRDWMGGERWKLWGGEYFDIPTDNSVNEYAVNIRSQAWGPSPPKGDLGEYGETKIMGYAPWEITKPTLGEIYKNTGYEVYLGSAGAKSEATGFERTITIQKYSGDDDVLVTSIVTWDDGDKEMVLEAVLTDWKGGAL